MKPINKVEFIGKYEDFNYEGDGVWRQWHYVTQRGELRRHIGTAMAEPYAVTWDNTWVPDQTEPVEIAARITDLDGYVYITQPVKVAMKREGRSVRMYKASNVPELFAVRVGRKKECTIAVETTANARAARLLMHTWSAEHGDEIGLNGTKLVDRVGLVHNYSFDTLPVPVRLVRQGDNTFHIFSNTKEHALEVNWPGPVLLVEYAVPVKPTGAAGEVRVSEVDYEGQRSFRIETPSATYIYHKEGAGLASIQDPDGNEWIGYKPGGRAAGEFRGIPNLGEFAHPGYTGKTGSTSRITSKAADRVSILSERTDGAYALEWDIFPSHARMTVLKAAAPYWFLYEGTPGGRLDLDKGFQVTSDGRIRKLAEAWSGDMPGPEWIYFGNTDSKYVLFVAKHDDDDAPDQYWPMDGSMTVFGFGREYRCCGRFLNAVPARFTIGLTKNAGFNAVAQMIERALR
jgi:hypothetical protein